MNAVSLEAKAHGPDLGSASALQELQHVINVGEMAHKAAEGHRMGDDSGLERLLREGMPGMQFPGTGEAPAGDSKPSAGFEIPDHGQIPRQYPIPDQANPNPNPNPN